jgi:ParB family chromosome partitioning protein
MTQTATEELVLDKGTNASIQVPTEQLKPSATNPRKTFNPQSQIEMAASVKMHGILQPLLCRFKDDGIEIVCGERRWRAARENKMPTVPIVMKELTDDQVLDIQIVENDQREDLHPLDRAAGYKTLIDAGRTIQQIAAKVGKSESDIKRSVILLALVPAGQKLCREGLLPAAQAGFIARLQPKDQKLALGRMLPEFQRLFHDRDSAPNMVGAGGVSESH